MMQKKCYNYCGYVKKNLDMHVGLTKSVIHVYFTRIEKVKICIKHHNKIIFVCVYNGFSFTHRTWCMV